MQRILVVEDDFDIQNFCSIFVGSSIGIFLLCNN